MKRLSICLVAATLVGCKPAMLPQDRAVLVEECTRWGGEPVDVLHGGNIVNVVCKMSTGGRVDISYALDAKGKDQ